MQSDPIQAAGTERARTATSPFQAFPIRASVPATVLTVVMVLFPWPMMIGEDLTREAMAFVLLKWWAVAAAFLALISAVAQAMSHRGSLAIEAFGKLVMIGAAFLAFIAGLALTGSGVG